MAVRRSDESKLLDWLELQGFVRHVNADDSDWNYVLRDGKGRQIDIHVFEFDGDGNHIYGIEYPIESLTGRAILEGTAIHCIAPKWMFRFKTAYDPAPKDLIDVHALAEKYGYDVPSTHQSKRGT